MACGSCAARRAAIAAAADKTTYVWMSEDGMREHEYAKEIEAKAKVKFKGGSYRPKKN